MAVGINAKTHHTASSPDKELVLGRYGVRSTERADSTAEDLPSISGRDRCQRRRKRISMRGCGRKKASTARCRSTARRCWRSVSGEPAFKNSRGLGAGALSGALSRERERRDILKIILI